MSKITALRPGKNREKQVNLYLDGKFAFSLEQVKARQEGLAVGLELTGDRLESIRKSLKISRCLNVAYRYLSYRPRSEAELKDRLQRRGFTNDQIEAALLTLKEQHFVDDVKFAEFWKENRVTFKPRSRWLTGRELAQKGVDAEIIGKVVADIDEDEVAYQAAVGRGRRFAAYDYDEFRQKIGAFLQRRGFNYAVVSRTVKRIWNEIKGKE